MKTISVNIMMQTDEQIMTHSKPLKWNVSKLRAWLYCSASPNCSKTATNNCPTKELFFSN